MGLNSLTAAERRAVNDSLAATVNRWHGNRDLDFVTLCEAMNAVAARTIRKMRERKGAA